MQNTGTIAHGDLLSQQRRYPSVFLVNKAGILEASSWQHFLSLLPKTMAPCFLNFFNLSMSVKAPFQIRKVLRKKTEEKNK